jgi:low temperature requirement protein LtrA
VLLGGPALYVAGRAGFEYTILARVSWNRPVGLVVLLALIPAALQAPPVAVVIAATGVLTGIVSSDAVRSRRAPAEVPSPPAGGSS